MHPLIQKTDCSGPYLAELRGNMLPARLNQFGSIAPEEVYPAELRDNMLIERRSRLQMRSGGAQQKKKHIHRNSAS